MKWTSFFLTRPVTALVINIMLIVLGVLAFRTLHIDEYPKIIIPKITVSTVYRNASADTIEKEVTDPLEAALSLVEGVDSISSESMSGESKIRLTFSSSVSMDRAVNQVNEQIGRIRGRLPLDAETPEIERGGERGQAIFYLSVKSNTLSGAALTHFTNLHIKNHFQGIEGAGNVQVWGPRYAMKISLDPVALFELRISPDAIVNVLKKNELLLQAGSLHQNEPINLDVVAKSASDYNNMIVGINGDVPVLLGDVASVNLIEDERNTQITDNGQKTVLIAISKASDANVLKVTDAIRKKVPIVNNEIHGQAEISIETDKSIFVRESLKTIYRTIIEACLLVILIIFLFLRHIRITLVPLVTIPISLIATFFALKIFGLSINTITLLALVLAVGLVVDDAIVVLENIFRYREQGLSAFKAAEKGVSEIGFAIIAMTLTLISVFLPLIFVSDITGTILREFAIALSAAVFFSGITALTLSPLMSAHMLKREPKENSLSLAIKRAISSLDRGYNRALHVLFDRRILIYCSLLAIIGLGIFLYSRLEHNLLPKEDRGIIGAFIPAMPGYDQNAMEPYKEQAELIFREQKEIENTLSFSFPNGTYIVSLLKPWGMRDVHAEKIVDRIRELIRDIPSVEIYPWSLNTGLSALKDENNEDASIAVALKSAKSYEELEAIANALVETISEGNILKDARSDLNMNQKAYSIEILREPMAALGIDEKMLSVAIQIFSDRMRTSFFKLGGLNYEVFLQSDLLKDDLSEIYVSTKTKDQVPLSTVAKIKRKVQSPVLKHLDQMRTVTILATIDKNTSLSSAKAYLDEIVKKNIPHDIVVSYQGALAMQEKSSKTLAMLFLAGLLFIFAIMAIQFEDFIDPMIILVTVPMAIIGAVFLLWATKTGTNLYTQVGMLTLIGLITKHGILLTEFVSHHRLLGMNLREAIFMAATWRFRPIIMTTAATVLGALPLVITGGAGVEARASIGLVIIGGMIFGTILTLFVLPTVIFSVYRLREKIWPSR